MFSCISLISLLLFSVRFYPFSVPFHSPSPIPSYYRFPSHCPMILFSLMLSPLIHLCSLWLFSYISLGFPLCSSFYVLPLPFASHTSIYSLLLILPCFTPFYYLHPCLYVSPLLLASCLCLLHASPPSICFMLHPVLPPSISRTHSRTPAPRSE